MTANLSWAQLYSLLQDSRILLSNGVGVDADSLGSMLAMGEALRSIGLDVTLSVPERIPEELRFLHGAGQVERITDCSNYDFVIGFECGDWKRFPFAEDFDAKHVGTCQMINIDHHPQSTPFGDWYIVDTTSSSTCEMIYTFLQESKIAMTPGIAGNLLAGLMSDTGSFVHANTTASVLRMAADLLRHGARTDTVARRLFQHKALPVVHLWGRVLARAKFAADHQAIISAITEQDLLELGLSPDQNEGIVETLNTAKEGAFTLLLTQERGQIKGSLRSEPRKGVDVSRLARLFGGGGHPLASGFTVTGQIVEKDGAWSIVESGSRTEISHGNSDMA